MQAFLVRTSAVITVLSFWSALATLMGGCPSAAVLPGGGTSTSANAAPLVSAGADLNADGGAGVTLSATASDPDGDPLTYAWLQLSGPTVTLAGEMSAAPSFTAPLVSGALTFRVTASDGDLSASDTVAVTVSVAPVLFIANYNFGVDGGVASYANPSTVNGNIAPDTNLTGAATQMSGPTDIVIDASGALIVANRTNAVRCYDDGPQTNGNFVPDRNLQGAATQLAVPVSLAIDTAQDFLFVANLGPPGGAGSIALYADASSASFSGNLPPLRAFSSVDISAPVGINLDATGTLYVANQFPAADDTIAVFANAANLNGVVSATRIIASPAFAGLTLYDAVVDGEDRLFVLAASRQVFVFENAATRNGAVMPDFQLTIPGAGQTTAIVVDSAGVGYIADQSSNAVYSYDGIATLNGTLPPDRTISGANTQFSKPLRLFLLER